MYLFFSCKINIVSNLKEIILGALHVATKCIYNKLDNNQKVLAVFLLDLVKAFDPVDHTKLLNILTRFGI